MKWTPDSRVAVGRKAPPKARIISCKGRQGRWGGLGQREGKNLKSKTSHVTENCIAL